MVKITTKKWLMNKYGLTENYFEGRIARETKKAIILRITKIDGFLHYDAEVIIAKSLIIKLVK